jgi:hypothetical protein
MSGDIDTDDLHEPGLLDCCEHCEHGVNDPPHDRPCPEGCNTMVDSCPDCGTVLAADEDGGWCDGCQRHISHARIASDPWRDE